VAALTRLNLPAPFINLIYQCISTTTLSVLVNGEPSAGFSVTRGIRQGCPLSPYLFVVAINELSISLQCHLQNSRLAGISLGPGCPPIHSLLFADDLIICGNANFQEAQTIHSALYDFCDQSGQTPNLNKSSILFSKNVPNQVRNQIKYIFPVPDLNPNTIHLGHPLIFNHKDRNKAYAFIKNKFHAKFTTVKANKLNHAGRLTYIQSVLSAIPVYYMSTILFSKAFIAELTTIIKRFWWAGIQEKNATNPIHFRSWEDICQSRQNGGLGIRDLHLVNKSLATNKNPFLQQIIKAKYYPTSSFWNATNNVPKSAFWSSILQVKQELSESVQLQLHQGNSSIWSAPWCDIWKSIHDHLLIPVTTLPLPSTVNQLWYPGTRNWNLPLLSTTFDNQAIRHIINTPTVDSTDSDLLRWTPAKDGLGTVKAIYKHLSNNNTVNIPATGTRSITPQANTILCRVWKCKSIPPIIKTFTWRLIRRALATADRATRFSSPGNNTCDRCNMIENDYHMFFQCTLPRQVWLTANPSINTANLPHEIDGVQSTLTLIVNDTTPEALLSKILYTLWFVWKARNDYHFNRKDRIAPQVHQAIQAYMTQNEQNPPTHHLSLLKTKVINYQFCRHTSNSQQCTTAPSQQTSRAQDVMLMPQ